jgi:hypothetical protein
MLSDEDFLSNTTPEMIEGLKNAAEQNLTMNEFDQLGGDVVLLKKNLRQYDIIKEFQTKTSGIFNVEQKLDAKNLDLSYKLQIDDSSFSVIKSAYVTNTDGSNFIYNKAINNDYENFVPYTVMVETKDNKIAYTYSEDHKTLQYNVQIVLADKANIAMMTNMKFINQGPNSSA